MADPDVKIIDYRGGVIRFPVPRDWVEEYEPDGGGAFHAGRPDSPTLFVNLLTFTSPRPDVRPESGAEALRRKSAQSGQRFVQFENRNAARVFSHRIEDAGGKGTLHRWEVVRAAPPRHIRLAVFSLALPDSTQDTAEIKRLLGIAERAARGCDFHAQPPA
jgi:hypothetical protein